MRSSYVGKAALPILVLSVSMLAGCAIPLKAPPEISYDDEAQPAIQLAGPLFGVGSVFLAIDDLAVSFSAVGRNRLVVDGEIECPFHQGRFDIRTGVPTYAPCNEALRVWTASTLVFRRAARRAFKRSLAFFCFSAVRRKR